MVQGLSHMTFIVRDLDRMEAILTTVLDARKVYDSGEQTFSLSKERFFLVGDDADPIWIATMEGEPLPTRTYNHVAFKIADADYETYLQRVRQLHLEVREGRSRSTSTTTTITCSSCTRARSTSASSATPRGVSSRALRKLQV